MSIAPRLLTSSRSIRSNPGRRDIRSPRAVSESGDIVVYLDVTLTFLRADGSSIVRKGARHADGRAIENMDDLLEFDNLSEPLSQG